MKFYNSGYLLIGVGAIILICILSAAARAVQRRKYHGGVRVANSEAVKKLDIYGRLLMQKRVWTTVLVCGLLTAAVSSAVLLARPVKNKSISSGIRKRDIFLCMDVSYSLYRLNGDLTEYLKKLVSELQGDRFGIAVYNTSTVIYVPMTDDYDYVLQRLDEIREYFLLQEEIEKYDDIDYYEMTDEQREDYDRLVVLTDIYDAGTLVNNYRKGSSLIGEGVATTLYSFPSLGDVMRTRVIIMSTDNAQEAVRDPLVDLKGAARLCRDASVTIFGIYPGKEEFYEERADEYDTLMADYKEAVELTGGKFYIRTRDNDVSDIVENIKKQEAMMVSEVVTRKITDAPETAAAVLFCSLMLCLLAGWRLER